ncbi:MAG: biotin/lipoyl-binding protein [Granulosicoccus sp.]|nr:biotin/lipoyl-binding protein [Granulosicoccus sp.]
MMESLLVANRGEIACRIMRTANRMGIRTVAIYSDADKNAPHVLQADEAWRVGPAAAIDSYLNIEAILSVAKARKVSAIHPGYGFLSENAVFAEECANAGIIFVGPSADAIAAMGSKSAAKKLMTDASVAVVPGYHGDAQDINTLTAEAERCGYPLLLKASAGGGGKGMRVVDRAEDLTIAVDAVKRESSAAFGDDHLLLERYLTEPRHIEIQVFGDAHGNFVHLFERDCSIQRRHQKIIEEAPAPGLSESQRSTMGTAAINAAKAINYCGAGTVEFIVEDDQFYFMEMNTRLQVEHPVTEMITGFDLVEWQLQVAVGEPLPVTQEEIHIKGHSIEVRLYAEDTNNNFLPASGSIEHLKFPIESENCRVDSGIRTGSDVSIYYDPMLAKLIAFDNTRDAALRTLLRMLDDTEVHGVRNNLDYLYRVADSKPFRDADLTTSFVERHEPLLTGAKPELAMFRAAAALFLTQENHTSKSAWDNSDGWRLNSPALFGCYLQLDTAISFVRVTNAQGKWCVECEGSKMEFSAVTIQHSSNRMTFTWQNKTYAAKLSTSENYIGVNIGQQRLVFTRHQQMPINPNNVDTESGLTAPMPGKVLQVLVTAGDQVKQGDPLVIVEAMKMEHTVNASQDGTIGEVFYAEGDNVDTNAVLLALE